MGLMTYGHAQSCGLERSAWHSATQHEVASCHDRGAVGAQDWFPWRDSVVSFISGQAIRKKDHCIVGQKEGAGLGLAACGELPSQLSG